MLDIKKDLLRLSEVKVIDTTGKDLGVAYEIRYCGFYLGAIDKRGKVKFLSQAKEGFNINKDIENYVLSLRGV